MKYFLSWRKAWVYLIPLVMMISACTTQPVQAPRVHVPRPAPAPLPVAGLEKHHVTLGDGVSVDYQIERKISSINATSCYAFITGTLNNDSNQALSRRTVIDFNFFSGGKQSFRDLTSPVSDVPPGLRVMFEMVVSPVHRDGCINYDRIDVLLRKMAFN